MLIVIDATKGVDSATWTELTTDGVLNDFLELNRLTFYGGVSPCLRKQVKHCEAILYTSPLNLIDSLLKQGVALFVGPLLCWK